MSEFKFLFFTGKFIKKLFKKQEEDEDLCHQIPEQQCAKTPIEICKDVQDCQKVPVKRCKAVPIQSCWTLPVQQCKSVPRQECIQVPKEICKQVRFFVIFISVGDASHYWWGPDPYL